MKVVTSEQWWAEIETLLTRAYIGVGCSFSIAKHLAPLAHQRYLDTSQWCLYEDVIPTLEALGSQGWKHAILSNHVPELRKILDAVGYEKPHPQTLWMIGDNIEADILGAQAVGIPAILVRKEDPRATYFYPDLSLIPDFLSKRMPLHFKVSYEVGQTNRRYPQSLKSVILSRSEGSITLNSPFEK